jgi:hypothetical protein
VFLWINFYSFLLNHKSNLKFKKIMKKQLFTLALVCASLLSINAQNLDYRSTLSGAVGLNGISLFSGLVNSASEETGITIKATPSFQLSYDYALSKWFSLGGAASFNSIKSSGTNFSFVDDAGLTRNGNYNFKGNRITVAARALFHYGNEGKLDMYSGLRVGFKTWTGSLTTTGNLTDNLKEDDIFPTTSGLNAQIIPFGLRYYVSDNFGLGFETALGAPYFAALQLNYRLGGGKK